MEKKRKFYELSKEGWFIVKNLKWKKIKDKRGFLEEIFITNDKDLTAGEAFETENYCLLNFWDKWNFEEVYYWMENCDVKIDEKEISKDFDVKKRDEFIKSLNLDEKDIYLVFDYDFFEKDEINHEVYYMVEWSKKDDEILDVYILNADNSSKEIFSFKKIGKVKNKDVYRYVYYLKKYRTKIENMEYDE